MKRFYSLSSLFVACCLLTISHLSHAATQIQGTVINGANNKGVQGIEVELRRNGPPNKPGKLITKTTSGDGGHFSFAVPADETDSSLMVRADYKGYPYQVPAYDGGRRFTQFDVDIDPTKVRLPIYESTRSLVPLEISASHLSIRPLAKGISCQEYMIVNNPTPKTFLGIGDDDATVLLDLPKGAKNVRIDAKSEGAKLNKRPSNYSVSLPIPPSKDAPGETIIVNYEMDWPSRLPWKRVLDLSREVQYPIQFFFVQRESSDRILEVKGFLKTDKKEVPLSSGQSIQMDINGEPQDVIINAVGNPQAEEMEIMPGNELHITVHTPTNPAFWAFMAFLLLIIVLVPFVLWKRPHSHSPNTDEVGIIVKPAQQKAGQDAGAKSTFSAQHLQSPEAQHLIKQIAILDDEYEAGKIDAGDYHAKRAAYKRELIQMASKHEN